MRFDLATVLASSYNEFGRIKTRSRNRSSIFVIKFKGIHFPLSDTQEGGGYYHIVWMGVCRWVRESPTLYQTKFCKFCDPTCIPDQE